MQAKKILFPTDFSHASDSGLPLATSMARDTGATLVILHVEEPPMAYGGGELYYGIPEPNTDALKSMLSNVRPLDPAVPSVHRMVSGDPATEIVHIANEEKVDMIVLGTHGRTGITRLLMGSVAEQVIRRAHCPVLVYKYDKEKK